MPRWGGILSVFIGAGFLAGALSFASDLRPFIPSEPPTASEQNLAVVVNLSNPIENLSMAELRSLFLGERSHWPNGRRITLVMMEPGQPERAAVLSLICQMNESDFKNHFLHGLFTGEVFVSPKTLATPVGVRKFIFNVPGAIGYLRVTDVDASVKVIRVDERLPEDKGYRLHIPPRPSKFVSPKTLATPVGVRKFIFNVPGAIGYLRATDVDASVKVIRVDERLPEDKGYRLHIPPRPSK